jgi:polyisoprenyl-phosphate glycosyltransferase
MQWDNQSCRSPKLNPQDSSGPFCDPGTQNNLNDYSAVSKSDSKLVSVVLPAFNEVQILRTLVDALVAVLQSTEYRYEIIFINDGSSDGSSRVLDELAKDNSRIKVLHLSRNFGHQQALLAGLRVACGDAVIVMDSDMQDDPAAIPKLLAEWEAGYEVVYAVRSSRKEHFVKQGLFRCFYRILRALSQTPIPLDAGNFGLIDRRVAAHVASLPERGRFYAGLRGWVGFRQTGVPVARNARHDQTPRVSIWGLIRLAKTAIFSFSNLPLIAFYGIAAASCCVCCGLMLFVLFHKLVSGLAIPGWTSGIIAASFFGTLNALGVAVLGEYVVAIYEEARCRPLYIIDRTVNLNTATSVARSHDTPGRRSKGRSRFHARHTEIASEKQ